MLKKNEIKVLLFIFTFFATTGLFAQGVNYQYDNAGNRTARVINMQSSSPMNSSQETTETLSLDDLVSNQKIKIYPNPTEGLLAVEIIDFTEQIKAEIQITDMSGRTINRKKIETGYTSFDLSNQSPGLYLLRIQINGESVTWKIIKK
jgi:hypothetical protein